MLAAFHEATASLLPTDEATLQRYLRGLAPQAWLPLAELFAARLPEFDAVIALPGDALVAEQVSRLRGVPLLCAEPGPGGWTLQGKPGEEVTGGEAVLLTEHLVNGVTEAAVIEQAQRRGLRVLLVGTAVERTSLGARSRLWELGVTVQTALQLADTPWGLIQERRQPERWLRSS
ncbi:hypothetical protein [Deinococcus reticulitermitis]|nr:hypothetical protein [Deinococcus reticulitermitis]